MSGPGRPAMMVTQLVREDGTVLWDTVHPDYSVLDLRGVFGEAAPTGPVYLRRRLETDRAWQVTHCWPHGFGGHMYWDHTGEGAFMPTSAGQLPAECGEAVQRLRTAGIPKRAGLLRRVLRGLLS